MSQDQIEWLRRRLRRSNALVAVLWVCTVALALHSLTGGKP